MAFADVWNPTYEGIPPDTENVSLGANRIRDLKLNIRERANIDHSWGDTLDNGQHNQISFNESSTDPTATGTNGYLYTKAVSGNSELFWEDQAGRVYQLTSLGQLSFKPFPTGTQIPFVMASPPSGWTVNAGYNDQMLRMVNSSGGGTGGSWTISGVSIPTGTGSLFASSSSTSNSTSNSSSSSSGSVSGSVAGTSLSADELPPHTHNLTAPVGGGSGNGGPQTGNTNATQNSPTSVTTDGGNGLAGNPHAHGWSGSISVSTSTTTTTTTTTSTSTGIGGAPSASFSNDATWRPAYVNAVVGNKT